MKRTLLKLILGFTLLIVSGTVSKAQILLMQDYQNYSSAPIGTFQGINFREAGFSALYPIAGTNGKEFWTCSDRGVNVDAANANPNTCRPTYDKIYSFPTYAPKIHRIRLNGDSIQILQSITMKRPNGTTVTGIINPTGFGSTAAEVASTDTVLNCANFNLKIAAKDEFGIDSEGLVVDADGNFWICEEGGPTIWKLNKNGVVLQRFSPYANLTGANAIDVQIDTVFKYRKNNRGFEGIAITPNGKIYAIIQSPLLFPTKSVGEGTMIHRILEIDPSNNATRMFAYLNDGIIGSSGVNQIRLRDWKIGDMAAINNNEFLVLEAALRGTTDIKRMYKIDISAATQVTSGLYGGLTLEALVNSAGLTAKGIVPVSKVLFMDLLANSWPASLEKAEGLAIVNDSTLVINNDNDYGQLSIGENGIATPNGILSHALTYRLSGSNKISNYLASQPLLAQGQTGPSTSQTPYINASIPGAQFTSILSAGEAVNSYKMAGIPDGLGAFDNGNNTFTLLVSHEIPSANGAIRAHGSTGAFVSKWVINKSNLSVVSGSDLMQNVKLWNGSGYTTYNSSNPSPLAAFSRFCSSDLPGITAFYNPTSSLGTQERIFLNGEEVGIEGRAMAHIATGAESGTSYELPFLGKSAWENAVASPYQSNKTIVGQTDDGTGGQVYFYIGTKTSIGSDVDKAGLTNGKLYGISVSGLPTELSSGVPAPNTTFSMVDLGQVANLTGAQLNSNSVAAGVTTFLRPEDAAWDPNHPSDFYFATTNSFNAPSRLWKVQFSDIANPEMGGSITAVLDGTEGQKMLDNLTIDNYGHILMQEDVGNNAHIGKVWQYSIATDALTLVGEHDPYRFLTGAPGYLTQDEESSGIIDAQSILGQGMFLLVDQAHYSIPGEVYEGGQLLALFNPATFNSAPIASNWNGSVNSDWNNALNW
ncbi:MAG: esterase-like activity of phytase family protein, partial [Bacteroidales bacterium]